MATRRAEAVLKIGRPDDYKKVLTRTNTVVGAMTENAATYTTPDPPLATLTAQQAVLQGYVDDVNEGDHSKIELRNEASTLLYRMLQQELIYVNKVGANVRGVLELSGFEVSDEPNPRPVPGQVIIKRIETGKAPGTAKIFIVKPEQTLLEYIVQTTITPETEASWKIVLVQTSSRELVLTDLTHGQEIWIRIAASNPNGQGLWSVPVSFIPQR